jgi:hypothetical protein
MNYKNDSPGEHKLHASPNPPRVSVLHDLLALPHGTSANDSLPRTFGTQAAAAVATDLTDVEVLNLNAYHEVSLGNSDRMAHDVMYGKTDDGQNCKGNSKSLKVVEADKSTRPPETMHDRNSSKDSNRATSMVSFEVLKGSVLSSEANALVLRADEKLNSSISTCAPSKAPQPFYQHAASASVMTGTETQCPLFTTLALVQANSAPDSFSGFPKGHVRQSNTGKLADQSKIYAATSASTLPGILSCLPPDLHDASNGSRGSPTDDDEEEIATEDESNNQGQSSGSNEEILHEQEIRHGFALFRELLIHFVYWEAAMTGYDKNRLLALLMPCDGSAMTTAIIAGVASQVTSLVNFALNSDGISHVEESVNAVIHEEEIQQGFALLRELLIFQIYNEEALTGTDKNRLLALLMPCDSSAVTIPTVIRVASQVQAARAALARHFHRGSEHSEMIGGGAGYGAGPGPTSFRNRKSCTLMCRLERVTKSE